MSFEWLRKDIQWWYSNIYSFTSLRSAQVIGGRCRWIPDIFKFDYFSTKAQSPSASKHRDQKVVIRVS